MKGMWNGVEVVHAKFLYLALRALRGSAFPQGAGKPVSQLLFDVEASFQRQNVAKLCVESLLFGRHLHIAQPAPSTAAYYL